MRDVLSYLLSPLSYLLSYEVDHDFFRNDLRFGGAIKQQLHRLLRPRSP